MFCCTLIKRTNQNQARISEGKLQMKQFQDFKNLPEKPDIWKTYVTTFDL